MVSIEETAKRLGLTAGHGWEGNEAYWLGRLEHRVAELEAERDFYRDKLESAKQKWLSNHSHHDCAACDALEEAFTYTVQ